MKQFDNRVAFVTGGASGIGLGMAKAFLQNGMKVVVADASREYLAEAIGKFPDVGDRVHFILVDVRDRTGMARAAEETAERFGNVHLLCNNAGVGTPIPIEDASYEDWDWAMGINLGGVINGIVTFLPGMKAHGEGGHIVNTASMAGIIPVPGWAGIYTTSKFAVRGLSEALRLSLGSWKIGVSTLCPGMVETRISQTTERLRPVSARSANADEGMVAPPALSGGMDPLEVGRIVLEGIRENKAFIFTHGNSRDEVAGLFDDILAAFPPAVEQTPEQIAFEDARLKMLAAAKAAVDAL